MSIREAPDVGMKKRTDQTHSSGFIRNLNLNLAGVPGFRS